MPLPTPDSADKVEQIMTTPKATNKDAVEGTPSEINHCAPVMLYKPDENDGPVLSQASMGSSSQANTDARLIWKFECCEAD